MIVPSSVVNTEMLKGGNMKFGTRVKIYLRKWRLFLVLDLIKWLVKKIKLIKVKKIIKKISAQFLAFY